jgi:GNAT superfamily N-acetyltransferase
VFQPLDGRHDRDSFDCGVPPLNDWLARNARQHEKKSLARTQIACGGNVQAWVDAGFSWVRDSTILGFYSLASTEVVGATQGAQALRTVRQVPAIRLGRLAVDRRVQGLGFGETLLMHAVKRCIEVSHSVGAACLIVDAKDESSANFYGKYGFEAYHDDPKKMWLLLRAIQ